MNGEIAIGEFLKAIQKPCRVYAQVPYTKDDMLLVQVVKADLIWTFKKYDEHSLGIMMKAFQNDDGDWIIN